MTKVELIKIVNDRTSGASRTNLSSAIISAKLDEDQKACIAEMLKASYYVDSKTVEAILQICKNCSNSNSSNVVRVSSNKYDYVDAITAVAKSDMFNSDKEAAIKWINKVAAKCYLREKQIKAIITITLSNEFSSTKLNDIISVCKSTIPAPTHTVDELGILLDIGATIGSILLSGR